MKKVWYLPFVAAVCVGLVSLLVSCSEEFAPLPTSSTPTNDSGNGQIGMTLSPLGVTAPPAPAPAPPDPEPEPAAPPENGDPVTVTGAVFGISGCPDNCVLYMKKYPAQVPANTRVTQTVGLATFERSTEDLRAGLPLRVRGTYRNGVVVAKKIIIKEKIRTTGTISSIDGNTLILETSSRAGATQVEFWIPHYSGVVFGALHPGTRVLVHGNVQGDLDAPFIATRVQPL